jgi:hypothetical protein
MKITVDLILNHEYTAIVPDGGTIHDLVSALADRPFGFIIINDIEYNIATQGNIKLADINIIDGSRITVWFNPRPSTEGFVEGRYFYSKTNSGLTFSHPISELAYGSSLALV